MAWKPKRSASTDFNNTSGIAKVQVKGNKVGVWFTETNKKFVFKAGDCPDNIQDGEWFVSLSNNDDGIWAFRPVKGHFKGKVTKFAAQEGEAPTPKVRQVSFTKENGKKVEYEYEYFTAIISISEPKRFAGIDVPYTLRYNFQEGDEFEGKPVVEYSHGKSKYTDQLDDFMEITGAWDRGPMVYEDNILPALEKRILREGKQFQFIVKNTWVDNIFPDSAFGEDEDDLGNVTIASPDFEPEEEELPWSEE